MLLLIRNPLNLRQDFEGNLETSGPLASWFLYCGNLGNPAVGQLSNKALKDGPKNQKKGSSSTCLPIQR